jgi:hypothetical protein
LRSAADARARERREWIAAARRYVSARRALDTIERRRFSTRALRLRTQWADASSRPHGSPGLLSTLIGRVFGGGVGTALGKPSNTARSLLERRQSSPHGNCRQMWNVRVSMKEWR